MRDPARIPIILDELKVLWERVPDMRLCQLLFNLHQQYDGFYVEDDYLLELIRRLK